MDNPFTQKNAAEKLGRFTQLEHAVTGYVSWFNHQRRHQALGDIPPVEYEALSQFHGHTAPSGSCPLYG